MKKQAARGIVIKDGKVLLIYRENKGRIYYTIPGGKVEENETLEQTVVREMLEETCITVEPVKLMESCEDTYSNKIQHIFLCKYIDGVVKLGDSVEMAKMKKNSDNYYEPMWVTLGKIESLDIKPDSAANFFRNFIRTNSS